MLPDTSQPPSNVSLLRVTSDCHENQKDERPFSCNHCDKSFGLKRTLDHHLRTHFRKRPYACHHCSWAFWTGNNLRRHLVNHSDQRPYECWICDNGNSFRRKDGLKCHICNTHRQPEVVAEKLANEMAAKYMKDITQSSVDIPVSILNYEVISIIIRNADLLPEGGIVRNNLKTKRSVQASTSRNMGIRRRDRMIVTTPLFPPTTRLSRRKETNEGDAPK